MTQPIATIIAATILSVAAFFLFRWEIETTGGITRLDRWTGAVSFCSYADDLKKAECR